MVYKSLEDRRKHYQKNKDKINERRREYSSKPDVKKRIMEQDRKWRINNKEKISVLNRKYKKVYSKKIKNLVFNHYGLKCFCCGESNLCFLSIDHINGGGTKHRGKINNNLYIWLVKNDFPKGYQTLCFNCNWGKHINKGICPHQEKS